MWPPPADYGRDAAPVRVCGPGIPRTQAAVPSRHTIRRGRTRDRSIGADPRLREGTGADADRAASLREVTLFPEHAGTEARTGHGPADVDDGRARCGDLDARVVVPVEITVRTA